MFSLSKTVIFRTELSEEEAIDELLYYTEPERTFRFGKYRKGKHKFYEGQINGKSFIIKRIIDYKNSFLPEIKGIIYKNENETIIHVKLKLNITIIVFVSLWSLFLFIMGTYLVVNDYQLSKFDESSLLPFTIIIFGYLIVKIGYSFECDKSIDDLRKIFCAEIKKP